MESSVKSYIIACFFVILTVPASALADEPGLNVYHGEIPEGNRVFYIAPDGDNSNPGTKEEPWATLDYAETQAQAGDVFVMRGGVYYHTTVIRLNRVGTPEYPITVVAYPGEVPILDFSAMPKDHTNTNLIGVRINGWYRHIIGITVRYAGNNGIRMDGSHNVLLQVTAYGNNDTGIHLAGTASHNQIINCDSFRNFNVTGRVGNNADGFGAKFGQLGPGNRFYGCRAWENSDDGFDFWEAPHTIVVENCWSFGNGDASVFGYPENFEGNGNGFKLGGNNVRADHVVKRSVAFNNFGPSGNAKGFDFNNNPGAMTLIHNTAFNNGRNFVFPLQPSDKPSVFINNLSVLPANQHAILHPNAVTRGNSWQYEFEVTGEMFFSLETEPAKGPRQQDGSLPHIDLLRPKPDSFLVDGGVPVAEPFYGSAPDIGAYEYELGELRDPWIERGSGNLIRDLIVYDMENANNWMITHTFETGMSVFGDRDFTLQSIPALLQVEEWVQTSMESRTINYLDPVARFELLEDRTIFVAHPDRITVKPEWLSEYTLTDMKITVAESPEIDRELTIYSRPAKAGDIISLGKNSIDGTTSSLMYIVMVGTTIPVTVDLPSEMPRDFSLSQNYPNPFNPLTTIEYTVPFGTHVTLTVYDVMGRKVTHLVDRYQEAGSHSVVWNAHDVPSGVYYYRISAGEFSEVRRAMLIK